jgi:hypothetical protein
VSLKKSSFIFLKYTRWQYILSFGNSSATYQNLKNINTLSGFEPRIFCSGGRPLWPRRHPAGLPDFS